MGKYTWSQYFRDQLTKLPIPKPPGDVSSMSFMVTGSNVGLGFEASVHLANMKPKTLVTTCRDQTKCEQTRKSILKRKRENWVPNAEVLALPLELGNFQDVRAFVDKFKADGNHLLHALIANAGVISNGYTLTPDGWETVLQVNYLSTALLSMLLLPQLIESSALDMPSRLVLVSSFAHHQVRREELDGAELRGNILATINKQDYVRADRYPISKLLGIIFVRELASRLPGHTPVIACTVNPGFCESNIFRTPLLRFCYFLLRRVFLVRSAEEGSRTLVHAAVASDRSLHGRYLSCCQVSEEDDFLFTPEGKAFSAKVWEETITILSGIDGRVSEIVEKYLRVD